MFYVISHIDRNYNLVFSNQSQFSIYFDLRFYFTDKLKNNMER